MSTDPTPSEPVRYRRLTAFFIPLALQCISQGSTHAIVAMVASRGLDGRFGFTGLAQASRIMFLLTSIGAGLVTTGMVYGGASQHGHRVFRKVFHWYVGGIVCLHVLAALPPVAALVFGRILGLPATIDANARLAIALIIPLNLLFLMRVPYFAMLMLHRVSGRMYLATLGRVLLTVLLAVVFVHVGLVGVPWAVLCMTVPVVTELVAMHVMTKPFFEALPSREDSVPSAPEMAGFSFMFSIGKQFIVLSGWVLVAFVARAAAPESTLAALAVVSALTGPICYAASRSQALYVAFAGSDDADRRVHRFVLAMGVIAGCVPFLSLLPGLETLYYVHLQKIPSEDLRLVRAAVLAMCPLPLLTGLRALAGGHAARRKRPTAVLAGEAAFMGVAVLAAFVALSLQTRGILIAPIGLLAGNLASFAVITGVLRWYTIRGDVAPAWMPR